MTGADVDISLGRWFAARAVRSPDRPALTFEGATLTYAELLERIDRLAGALRARGVRPGDRVAFLGANQPSFFEVLFAAARLGAVFVPLNVRLTGPELAFIVGDAGAHTLVVDPELEPVLTPVRDHLALRHVLSSRGPGYEALLAEGPIDLPAEVGPDEVALLMYTSGTTGQPKGAMLTHANLWWNNINSLHAMDIGADEVTLVVAPLFHIGGLNTTALLTWQKGGEVVLHPAFDPEAVLRDVTARGITSTFAVPAMLQAISHLSAFGDADLSSLRLILCGGAPVPATLLTTYEERGVMVQQGYGLTETAPIATFLSAESAQAKLGSAGLPPLFSEVRIVDPAGVPIETPLERGEVCCRGPNVMRGYWNRPDATRAVIDAEGWFHSGDVGHLDADGYLYIVDRVKDMVITGGENVYPAEVEAVLHTHPEIRDVAVIGLPDPRWGETVVAVVVAGPGTAPTLESVRDFASERLARFKLPTRVVVVDELPRNAAGKVLKHQLRSELG